MKRSDGLFIIPTDRYEALFGESRHLFTWHGIHDQETGIDIRDMNKVIIFINSGTFRIELSHEFLQIPFNEI